MDSVLALNQIWTRGMNGLIKPQAQPKSDLSNKSFTIWHKSNMQKDTDESTVSSADLKWPGFFNDARGKSSKEIVGLCDPNVLVFDLL